jgi:glycosyltransferase involved in cell wall biosynthesis
MRILYDGEILKMQRAGGVNRYFANLISNLPPDFYPTLLVHELSDINRPSHPNLKVRQFGSPHSSGGLLRVRSRLAAVNDRYLDSLGRFIRFDVAHPTYYTLLSGHVSKYHCPVVVNVWDMVHELFAEEMDPTGWNAEQKRQSIMAADVVICISENTKSDLLRYHPSVADRIKVIYLASELDETMSHGPEATPSEPYFLYIGNRLSYKNVDMLLSAFAKVAAAQRSVKLCLVGAPFSDDEQKNLHNLGITDRVVRFDYATDNQLAKLYRCSVALVYPSLYEGFGIPPLEAMACGTPVIAANCASLPEVVADAGVLIDPYKEDEMVDAMWEMLRHDSTRQELIKKGHRRAKEFSWHKTVAATIDIYRSLARAK